MTNNPSQSLIIQQLLETLERIELDATRALDETTQMTEDAPDELGYVRASGYSKGILSSIKITAQVNRKFFTNA
jgi:hypothetical protein